MSEGPRQNLRTKSTKQLTPNYKFEKKLLNKMAYSAKKKNYSLMRLQNNQETAKSNLSHPSASNSTLKELAW
jgi:hypothetical protein